MAGFATASLGGVQQGVAGTIEPMPTPAASAPGGPGFPPARVVEDRQAAVIEASGTLRAAQAVKTAAVAASVPAEATWQLDEAIGDLRAAITVTQAAQPAVLALQPPVAPSPVRPLDAVISTPGEQAEPAPTTTATALSQSLPEASDAVVAAPVRSDGGSGASVDAAVSLLLARTDRVAALTAELQVVTAQAQEAAVAAAAARVAEQEAAARKQAQRTSLDQYANGEIPLSALCELDFAPGHQQRCDATDALEELNTAFERVFSTSLVVTDSYRSYAAQVACRRNKGSLCATPGTSNHGTGVAVDFGGGASSFGTSEHEWLLEHAGEYGWTLPSWARASGSKPEPWHWEYVG
ncbi:M15 family metallopeptidase [Cellulomonas denverensis]|nr:M15 family metallopeptidase [Cellulomonas denverensis]